ncbi:ArnT family glycosyltransferase [Patescibacteria group bacterium]
MNRIILFLIVATAVIFSFYSPLGDFTATPKFWRDEAIPFEIARTFLELGKLDVVVEPGIVDGRPYLSHATGFTMTIPLAGFFSIFGIGVLQARIFMIVWIFITLLTLFLILKSFFGTQKAAVGTLLVSTFTSFYANGKTFTGEIPGFFFLLLGIYMLYKKKNYVLAGVFMGLCAITKPSVFLLILPVVALEFLISERRLCFKHGFKFVLGAIPIMLLWIIIILPQPFSIESWQGMIDLYRHPFNEASLLSHFPDAIIDLVKHTTIIYFAILAGILGLAYRKGAFTGDDKRLMKFVFLYSIAAAVYFLRSPGWIRYLLIFEVLALATVFPAIDFFAKKIKIKSASVMIAGVLVLLHTVNFFFISNIPSSDASIKTADFINNEILAKDKDATVGFIYMSPVAALISPWNKYQINTIGGKETYGKHPLSFKAEKLPTYIVGYNGEYEEVLKQYYEFFTIAPGEHTIYKKK